MLLYGPNQIMLKSTTLKCNIPLSVCFYEIHDFAMNLSPLYNTSFVSDYSNIQLAKKTLFIAGENYKLPLISGCWMYLCIELRIEARGDKLLKNITSSKHDLLLFWNDSLPFSFWNDCEGWCPGPKMFLVSPLMSVEDGWFLDLMYL